MRPARDSVAVALSGGVDSSVAAALLVEQGLAVIGLHMVTGVGPPHPDPDAPADAAPSGPPPGRSRTDGEARARSVANHLGIPFHAVDLRARFDRLIDDFTDEYLRGRTPNPCLLCNRDLKFGQLFAHARAAGADRFATGHYARIDCVDGLWRLRRAADADKDQSYALFVVGRDLLPRILLPLGLLTKAQVREHARRLHLPVTDSPESQDICFAPDRDYARIVRQRRPDACREGPIVDMAGREVGRHAGIAHFTVGQRRGLRIALGRPVYVVRLDAARNAVVVGNEDDLASDTLYAARVCWLAPPPDDPFRASVRIRYSHPGATAVVEPLAPDRVRVRFDVPQRAVTPGQAAVFYNDDLVLGGGWIE